MALLAAALPAAAQQPDHVTVKDKMLCRTLVGLREALQAMEAKDKEWLDDIPDCHLSIAGVPALIVQDNISRVKVRLFADDEQAEMWTTPEAIRPIRGRR